MVADQHAVEPGLRLATALGWFWYRRNHDREGWDWLATFRSGGDADDALASTALTIAGTLAVRLGQHAEAVALQRTALERCRRRDDRLGMARALRGLGDALAGIGDLPQADAALTESVAIFRELGATWDEAVALHWFGIVAYAQADYPTATTRFQARPGAVRSERRRRLRQLDAGQRRLGGAHSRRSRPGATGLRRVSRGGLGQGRCLVGGVVPDGERRSSPPLRGAYTQAARLYGVADGLRAAAGAPLRPSVQAKYDELVAACRAALGSAAWEEAYACGRMVPLADAVAEGRAVLATDPSSTSIPGARAAAAYRLTPREFEVLRLLVLGRSDREIAERLFVSHRTVQDHVSHLLAKLGVANRTEASGLAIRERLI